MKRIASGYSRKIILICPRCGKKQAALSTDTKFLILCPQCGAGMREQPVRPKVEQ